MRTLLQFFKNALEESQLEELVQYNDPQGYHDLLNNVLLDTRTSLDSENSAQLRSQLAIIYSSDSYSECLASCIEFILKNRLENVLGFGFILASNRISSGNTGVIYNEETENALKRAPVEVNINLLRSSMQYLYLRLLPWQILFARVGAEKICQMLICYNGFFRKCGKKHYESGTSNMSAANDIIRDCCCLIQLFGEQKTRLKTDVKSRWLRLFKPALSNKDTDTSAVKKILNPEKPVLEDSDTAKKDIGTTVEPGTSLQGKATTISNRSMFFRKVNNPLRKIRLALSFEGPRKLTAEIFNLDADYHLTKSKGHRNHKKFLQYGQIYKLLSRVIENHNNFRRNHYRTLLQKHCSTNRQSKNSNSCIEKSVPRGQVLDYAISQKSVIAFVIEIVIMVFPLEIFGSLYNRRIVFDHIGNFITMNKRYEVATTKVFDGIRLKDISWLFKYKTLRNQTQKDIKDFSVSKQGFENAKIMLSSFLQWFFNIFISTVVSNFFHVTHMTNEPNWYFFFYHKTWNHLQRNFMKLYVNKCLKPASPLYNGKLNRRPKESVRAIRANELGAFESCLPDNPTLVSRLGLFPKANSLRMICFPAKGGTNLEKIKYFYHLKRTIQPVNCALKVARNAKITHFSDKITKFQTVTTVNDIVVKLRDFIVSQSEKCLSNLPNNTKKDFITAPQCPKFYFKKFDIRSCYDLLPRNKLADIIDKLLEDEAVFLYDHTSRKGKFATQGSLHHAGSRKNKAARNARNVLSSISSRSSSGTASWNSNSSAKSSFNWLVNCSIVPNQSKRKFGFKASNVSKRPRAIKAKLRKPFIDCVDAKVQLLTKQEIVKVVRDQLFDAVVCDISARSFKTQNDDKPANYENYVPPETPNNGGIKMYTRTEGIFQGFGLSATLCDIFFDYVISTEFDTSLEFSNHKTALRSAPFERPNDALRQSRRLGENLLLLRYADDFLIVSQDKNCVSDAFLQLMMILHLHGVEINEEKTVSNLAEERSSCDDTVCNMPASATGRTNQGGAHSESIENRKNQWLKFCGLFINTQSWNAVKEYKIPKPISYSSFTQLAKHCLWTFEMRISKSLLSIELNGKGLTEGPNNSNHKLQHCLQGIEKNIFENCSTMMKFIVASMSKVTKGKKLPLLLVQFTTFFHKLKTLALRKVQDANTTIINNSANSLVSLRTLRAASSRPLIDAMLTVLTSSQHKDRFIEIITWLKDQKGHFAKS